MRRREFISLLGGAAAWPLAGRAQQPAKVVSIGWLTAQRASSLTPFLGIFRSSLAELGYREGDNLKIEYRYGDDNLLRVAPLAAELTRQGVSLLVVQGAAVPLVHELKLPLPSVYVFSGDPVVARIAESLARPGGLANAGWSSFHRHNVASPMPSISAISISVMPRSQELRAQIHGRGASQAQASDPLHRTPSSACPFHHFLPLYRQLTLM
jgi:hypothetical protein